jgi:hypothetical protein
MKNFNEMNWNELRAAAKANGIKVTNMVDVLFALNRMNITKEDNIMANVNEEVEEEVIGEIEGTSTTNETVIEESNPAKEEKAMDNVTVEVLPVRGEYIQNKFTGRYYRISGYCTIGKLDFANVVYKNKLEEEKVSKKQIKVSELGITYVKVPSEEVHAYIDTYMAALETKPQFKAAPVKQNRYEVNVSVNQTGYRSWSVKDKVSGQQLKADEGHSVTKMVRDYSITINNLKMHVTETIPTTATAATKETHKCPHCGKTLSPTTEYFFKHNTDRLPKELQVYGAVCYDCQNKLGMKPYFVHAQTKTATK